MTTFGITRVYQTVDGVEKTPAINDAFRMVVEFTVNGTPPTDHYHVNFEVAGQHRSVTCTDLTLGAKRVVSNEKAFPLPLDGDVPWSVEVLPHNVKEDLGPIKMPSGVQKPFSPETTAPHAPPPPASTAPSTQTSTQKIPAGGIQLPLSHTWHGSFQPAGPAETIEYYAARLMIGMQTTTIKTSPGAPLASAAVMTGWPTTDSWQKASGVKTVVKSPVGQQEISAQKSTPAGYPVGYWRYSELPAGDIRVTQTYAIEAKNSRVNMQRLRQVSWGDLDAVTGAALTAYRQPEDIIESQDPKIEKFVTDNLGSDYRKKLTPYDAARTLFQAVLRRVTYFYPQPGEVDKRPPTAVGVLDAGIGDCGGFSIALVALYRHIGFAARTAYGAWGGAPDAAHCWCEMWFPGHGWMVSDGSMGNGLSEDGSFAYYFGNIPDLNNRYAEARGNTFKLGDSASWLQGPMPFIEPANRMTSFESHSSLGQLHLPFPTPQKPMSADEIQAQLAAQAAAPPSDDEQQSALPVCPCQQHGGFRPSTADATVPYPRDVAAPTPTRTSTQRTRG